jgi:hypothetical protein
VSPAGAPSPEHADSPAAIAATRIDEWMARIGQSFPLAVSSPPGHAGSKEILIRFDNDASTINL